MSIEGAGGRHIILTGASSGIGEATARHLASQGHRLVLAARRGDRLEALAREINPTGKRVIAAPTDVTRREDLEALVARARGIFGPVDALVNNAGVSDSTNGLRGRWWQYDADAARAMFETNLLSAVELSRLVLPDMLEHRSGSIINVGSVAGRVAFSTLYSATKFGLRGFSMGLRRELLGTGVHVSLVAPGFIKTAMTSWGPPVPMPEPIVVARAIADLLERPRAEVIVPGWYRPLAWLETLAPALGDFLILRSRGAAKPVQDE